MPAARSRTIAGDLTAPPACHRLAATGQALVEYGLILTLIAVVAIGALLYLRRQTLAPCHVDPDRIWSAARPPRRRRPRPTRQEAVHGRQLHVGQEDGEGRRPLRVALDEEPAPLAVIGSPPCSCAALDARQAARGERRGAGQQLPSLIGSVPPQQGDHETEDRGERDEDVAGARPRREQRLRMGPAAPETRAGTDHGNHAPSQRPRGSGRGRSRQRPCKAREIAAPDDGEEGRERLRPRVIRCRHDRGCRPPSDHATTAPTRGPNHPCAGKAGTEQRFAEAEPDSRGQREGSSTKQTRWRWTTPRTIDDDLGDDDRRASRWGWRRVAAVRSAELAAEEPNKQEREQDRATDRDGLEGSPRQMSAESCVCVCVCGHMPGPIRLSPWRHRAAKLALAGHDVGVENAPNVWWGGGSGAAEPHAHRGASLGSRRGQLSTVEVPGPRKRRCRTHQHGSPDAEPRRQPSALFAAGIANSWHDRQRMCPSWQ